jgi:hypothetical protein
VLILPINGLLPRPILGLENRIPLPLPSLCLSLRLLTLPRLAPVLLVLHPELAVALGNKPAHGLGRGVGGIASSITTITITTVLATAVAIVTIANNSNINRQPPPQLAHVPQQLHGIHPVVGGDQPLEHRVVGPGAAHLVEQGLVGLLLLVGALDALLLLLLLDLLIMLMTMLGGGVGGCRACGIVVVVVVVVVAGGGLVLRVNGVLVVLFEG